MLMRSRFELHKLYMNASVPYDQLLWAPLTPWIKNWRGMRRIVRNEPRRWLDAPAKVDATDAADPTDPMAPRMPTA
jgi:hypothetical protein